MTRSHGSTISSWPSSDPRAGRPALLPRLELWSRLRHRADAARRVFEQHGPGTLRVTTRRRPGSGPIPKHRAGARSGSRHSGCTATVVLVHGPPGAAASALAREQDISFDEALALWDEYNRMALSLWEEFSGIVVGWTPSRAIPKSGARELQEQLPTARAFPRRPSNWPQLIQRFDGFGVPETEPVEEVSNKFLVLDRVLRRAGRREPIDTQEMVEEFANYYDEDYYTHYGNEGDAPYRRGESQWETFFAMLARRIAEDLQPDSVLDAGCAIGFLVEALRNRGIDAWGLDVSEWAISQVPGSIKPYCSVASLTDEINGHFDLVTMIEVIEHLPDSVAEPVIANIARHAESVLLSSTSDGFEEATHINVRTPDHWARLFAAQGFVRDFDYDASYLSKTQSSSEEPARAGRACRRLRAVDCGGLASISRASWTRSCRNGTSWLRHRGVRGAIRHPGAPESGVVGAGGRAAQLDARAGTATGQPRCSPSSPSFSAAIGTPPDCTIFCTRPEATLRRRRPR